MPGMDGLELIRSVQSAFPEVSIIAMTGYSRGYRYIDVINSGAKDFINKPFGIEELEAKIRRAIRERNALKELSRLSITDSLTGLYNQRHFYARLKEEIVRAQRQKHPLALVLLDMDNFKTYNDTHGHLAGDELLQNVGRIINNCIRENVDSGYRYGGDEFAIILIDADAGNDAQHCQAHTNGTRHPVSTSPPVWAMPVFPTGSKRKPLWTWPTPLSMTPRPEARNFLPKTAPWSETHRTTLTAF